MGLVLRRSLIPIVAGLIAGITGSRLVSRALAALLYQVPPGDPAVLGAIVALLAGTAIAACVLPARRAAAVDPMVVLKEN